MFAACRCSHFFLHSFVILFFLRVDLISLKVEMNIPTYVYVYICERKIDNYFFNLTFPRSNSVTFFFVYYTDLFLVSEICCFTFPLSAYLLFFFLLMFWSFPRFLVFCLFWRILFCVEFEFFEWGSEEFIRKKY